MIKRDFSVPIYYAREMFPDCATRHYCYLLPFNLKKKVLRIIQDVGKKSLICFFNLQIL